MVSMAEPRTVVNLFSRPEVSGICRVNCSGLGYV
jgi:hypothetical protein